MLKILSFVLCLAFFCNMAESLWHDSAFSAEMAEKTDIEKSTEKDVEKEPVKDKFFASPDTIFIPQFTIRHFIKDIPFTSSAYLSLPELPPEMI